jgi:hypothetical protein
MNSLSATEVHSYCWEVVPRAPLFDVSQTTATSPNPKDPPPSRQPDGKLPGIRRVRKPIVHIPYHFMKTRHTKYPVHEA